QRLVARTRRLPEERVPVPPFLRPRFGRRVQHHHSRARVAVGRPARKARAIRIAAHDEVDPVARRELRQIAIGVLDRPRKGAEIVEHIEDFAGMKGAGVAARPLAEPALRRERAAVETEAENAGAAGLLLRLDPGPGRVDDDEVAAERAGGSRVRLRRSGGIELERRLRPLTEACADKLGEGTLRIVALKKGEVEALVL